MRGFWELPMWELDRPGVNLRVRENRPSRKDRTNRKDGIILGELVGRLRHSITTNQIEVAVYEARLARRSKARQEKWARLDQIEHLPVTTITRKALALQEGHPS